MAATMSSCRVFGAGRLRAGGCVPSPSRNAGGSGEPSKNAPAPAGGVPSKERRDMPAAFGGSGQPGAQRTAALGESGQLLSAQRSLSKPRADCVLRPRAVLSVGGCRITVTPRVVRRSRGRVE